ncbi:phosphohistidine phosphatase SixA [Geobacter pickeringii]|uniref:Phosphohistidine phosphatase n=1 Tax=Geobacter pickeringii TaxID=345632 RepID=A0A0B5BF10_9BACT|nr:phosphohistidine phosphatase SixA [Geobacter pickeringii]AJE03120.1 hypothetical protein GPICK_06835 [Geobacter pickeringii]
MKLYIVRHAEAIERNGTVAEEERYLTPKGRITFRQTGAVLKKKGVLPDLVLTSPLVRAVQTADILVEALSFEGEVQATASLAPGFDLDALRLLLDAIGPCRKVAIVGHEPDLGCLVSSLLGLEAPFRMKKGAVVALDVEPTVREASARFRWLVHNGRKPIRKLEDAGAE